jgi:hypothetical protein
MPAKPATVRFYVDADILGLAKVLGSLRSDVTYPGDPGATIHRRVRPPCEVTSPAIPDEVWNPAVTSRGWLIITGDRHLQSRPAELAAVREAGARMVALSGRDAKGTWDQLEVFMTRWRDIEELLSLPGPFVRTATRTGIRPVDWGSN